MKKKFFSLVLALAMVLPLCPALEIPVFAATRGTTGDCTWSLSGTTLTISGSGAMADYEIDYDLGEFGWPNTPWNEFCIEKVVIQSGVTHIGNYAFSELYDLTSSVSIPSTVKSIGDSAFYYTPISSVTIPSSVTRIGDDAFSCTELASISFPNSVIDLGRSVFGFTPWEEKQTASAVYLGKVLYKLQSDKLQSDDTTYTVKDGTLGIACDAFYDCESLTTLVIPDSVKVINPQSGCSNLSTFTVSSGNTAYQSKGNCLIETATKTLIRGGKKSVIPSDGSVTAIGRYAFDSVSGITSIEIPDSVTRIESWAFSMCTALTSVVIPNSVTSIGEEAFASCESLTSVMLPRNITYIEDSTFMWCTDLRTITIPRSVTGIGENAFLECYALQDVWYEGTSSDRARIAVEEGEFTGDRAEFLFYYATWHYNACIRNPSSTNKVHSYSAACDTDCNYCGKTRTASAHTYSNACDTTCNVCGATRTAGAHTYTDACDTTCNVCGATRTAPHSYSNECDSSCNLCGMTRTITHYTKTQVSSAAHTTKNDTAYPFTQSGGWTVSTNKNASTTSTYTITANHACTLTLNYKVSSEKNYDKMTVKKNSTTLDTISGEVEKSTTITLAKGDTVTVSYAKDGRTDGGNDCAYFKFSCNCTEEREVPSSTLSPTCIQGVVCSRCGVTIKAATGHSYDNVCDATCNTCGATRSVPAHVYSNTCDPSCNVCGATRTVTHTYTNTCDTSCNVCGATRTVTHTFDNACDKICNVCGVTRTVGAHVYDNTCDETCNECGAKRSVTHTYDNTCDTSCNVCGATRTITHTYSNACDTTCNVCGATRTAGAHAYTDACDSSCNVCGATRTAPHSYSNECDSSCNLCGMTRTITHYTKTQVSSAAHTTKNDSAYPFTQSGGWTVSTNKTKSTTSAYVITAQHACTLTLNYKVSSESGYDKMTVKKNSTTLDTISGEVEKSTTITLAKGDTVTISYAKDGRTDGGNDCAYFKFSCTCAAEQEVPSSTLSPTCTQGVVCSRCGITVKSAAGHKYDNACDTTCNTCGATRTAGAHVYSNTCDPSCNVCGATRTVTHTYSNTCDTSCNVCGATRTVTHTFDNACDKICNVCGANRTVPAHVYDNTCDETCNECGAKRSVTHTYDNTCDTSCNVCGAIRTIAHTYSNDCDTTCNICGATRTAGAHVYDNTCDETCNECGATRTVTHTYSNACDKTCNVCGATRTVPAHIYDSVCDETCNECGAKRSVAHTYDDDYDETCNVCGAVRSVVLALRTTLSKSVIDHGDTVVVSFSLSKPVMIKGFGLDYSAIYDKDAFEWVSGDWSEQIRTNSMLAQANPGTHAAFAAVTAFNVSGEIFTMTLRVKDGAKCGIQKIDAPQITQIQNVTLFGSEIKVNHVFDDAKDLICNACGYERPPYTPGDVDDNGKVEMADAIHLLFHVNFPANYSVNQPVDFDGNGKVEMADAIYLLFHVNFPDSYPLN